MGNERIEEVISTAIRSNNINLHTALPAEIITFDASTQLASVKIAIKELLSDGSEVEFPNLLGIPVIFNGSGDFVITQPVVQGDKCLLIFTDKSIDTWKQSGAGHIAKQARSHDLSDAIAIMGAKSQQANIPNFDNENLVIRSIDSTKSIKLLKNGGLQIVANDAKILFDTDNKITITSNQDINITAQNSNVKLLNGGKIKLENNTGEVIQILADVLNKLKVEPNLTFTPDYIIALAKLESFI